jgi:hypothetical protein
VSAPSWQILFQPDERLLWEGTPLPGVRPWPKIIFLAVFGIPFLIVGIGLFGSGLRTTILAKSIWDVGLGLFLAVFSIPFAGAGAIMVFGQWLAARSAHRKIRYAISTRCAYVAKAYLRRSLEVYPILPSTAVEIEKCGSYDNLWFHALHERDSDGGRTTTKIGFEGISDAETPFRLIRKIQTGTA